MSDEDTKADAGDAAITFKDVVENSIADAIEELNQAGARLTDVQARTVNRTLARLTQLAGVGLASPGGQQDQHARTELESLRNTLTAIAAEVGFDAAAHVRGFMERLTTRLTQLAVSALVAAA